MRIIERFCQGKRQDPSLNEDGLIVTDGFAAVVDGVTSKSVRHLWQPSGGVVAKDYVLATIAELASTATMREVQQAIDAHFQQAYHEQGYHNIVVHEPIERLQANAVIYSVHRREIWLFGDCQVMVNGQQTPTVKRVDELLGELRAFTMLALRRQQSSATPTESSSALSGTDPARDMILPFLRLQSQFANARGPYGYFVFDGFTDLTYPIRTVTVSPGDEVVLASDGYPVLRPTLAASESALQRLKREDPELISEYQSTKGFREGYDSFDDRTYLRFIV
ncbi:hypothetical protein [Bifidobacterium cebidarum]|uniref:PPM-type phosphatase domain-containing protein n=1 Tax=Bifidobacterium cebidarum TaxID=2650773 RepID=A0A6I1GBG2_9BIFI|nr:hypothetical protein [Bifidobacterium cebidarum]KAB7788905.1 hypothetical protein F7D08_0639 [Bifidobacterium cebidarum]